MKLVRNTGNDRVVDIIRSSLDHGKGLDMVTPTLSVFAFAELLPQFGAVGPCRLVLPPSNSDLVPFGTDADRPARNRLQSRWLAGKLASWLAEKTDIRSAAKERWDQAKTDWALAQQPSRIHFGPDESTIPNRKSYLAEIATEPFSSVFYRDGRSATLEVENLLGKGFFPFPKNTDVLAEFIELLTEPTDVILDFFAGSGSTGHAVLKVNEAHDTQRRYVLVQLQEPTDRKEYPTVSAITKRRLLETSNRLRDAGSTRDLGFRVLKLDLSNIRAWEPSRDDLTQTLLDSVEHLKPHRSEVDVLFELLLKLGLDLCVPIATRSIAGKDVHGVGGGVLVACLAEKIDRQEVEQLAQGIVAWHRELSPVGETPCVFRDSAFADDVAKTNMAAILEQHGIANVKSL